MNGVRIGPDGLIKDHYHIFMLKEGYSLYNVCYFFNLT